MQRKRITAAMAIACAMLLLTTLAQANERQTASPVWGSNDDQAGAIVEAYDMIGLDFDIDVSGLELVEEPTYTCILQSMGGGMIAVKHTFTLRFHDSMTGSKTFATDALIAKSQAFPNPFDASNQDMSGNLRFAYVDDTGDRTPSLQNAVTGGADPTDTLCRDNPFPDFGQFGVNIATTTGGNRTLIIADTFHGGYAMKGDPTNNFWEGNPLEGIGRFMYWAIEVTSGAGNKGTLLSTKSLNAQSSIDEATPNWQVDTGWSLVGDILGTGSDVMRIVDAQPDVTPNQEIRRVRHFDVRTGARIGPVWERTVSD